MCNKEECPKCGKKYKRLGQHWAMSSECSYPSFTEKQKQIITGLLMGDGCINRGSKNQNPCVQCKMISQNYLKYIDNIFECFGTGVSLYQTAKENAKESKNSGFSPNAKMENYSDSYVWQSRRHADLQKWADWYKTGKKVWPKNIELTPTILKHWYCGDGCWESTNSHNRIRISMANEIENQKKVSQMFENIGLPLPSNYNVSEREDGSKTCAAVWTKNQSKELWDYMGKPLPDFYYKWPEQYH